MSVKKFMNTQAIENGFSQMGARIKVREVPSRWRQGDRTWISPGNYSLDIQRDGQGQFFELRVPSHLRGEVEATVAQNEPGKRHLLLFVRQLDGKPQLDRFLCGHDEREWFVAAVPGGASSVRQAMDALQPAPVHEALARQQVTSHKRYLRKNRAFRRQGEWFFLPEPQLVVDPKRILRHEPLRRGAGKPHWVEQVFRTGGETVYVCDKHPNGVSPSEYQQLRRNNPKAARWSWRVMQRDMGVYARGDVSHPDHATIRLAVWHRVAMNTETQTRIMSHVAFLD